MIINKNDLPTNFQNERITQNNKMIDELLVDDYINVLIKQYNLEKYTYIDDIRVFSLLPLRGSLKYINKYTNELRNGGLLIKIYQKNSKWYGIIKKINGRKFHVSFSSNYIFYLEHRTRGQKMRETLELFMSDINKGKYDVSN
jgi:hypothetical protein